jgi:hypothetical protein
MVPTAMSVAVNVLRWGAVLSTPGRRGWVLTPATKYVVEGAPEVPADHLVMAQCRRWRGHYLFASLMSGPIVLVLTHDNRLLVRRHVKDTPRCSGSPGSSVPTWRLLASPFGRAEARDLRPWRHRGTRSLLGRGLGKTRRLVSA